MHRQNPLFTEQRAVKERVLGAKAAFVPDVPELRRACRRKRQKKDHMDVNFWIKSS
jgi:hypothetical protein